MCWQLLQSRAVTVPHSEGEFKIFRTWKCPPVGKELPPFAVSGELQGQGPVAAWRVQVSRICCYIEKGTVNKGQRNLSL